MPKLPAGWMYQAGPGGAAVAAPIPGTTDWSNGVAKAESLQSADTRVGQMLDMLSGVEKTTEAGNKVRTEGMGTELWGQNAAKYSVLRGQIISDLGKQREMGVLDQKEYDRLVDQLPDPTSMGSLLTRNSTMQAGYQELRKQMRGKRKEHLRANPWLVPTVPKGFEPVDE